jgi:hypothetical protein
MYLPLIFLGSKPDVSYMNFYAGSVLYRGILPLHPKNLNPGGIVLGEGINI